MDGRLNWRNPGSDSLNRDATIVALAVILLLVVAYQGGYILSDEDSSDSTSTSEPQQELEQSNSLDEIHPLASTCLSHGELTRHDHMYLTIQIEDEFVTIPENVGVNTNTCNQSGANMHVVHTHSSDGKLHLEMQTDEDVELGVFFDIWGQHFDETGIFDYRVNSTHELVMYNRDVNGTLEEVDSFDNYILLNNQDIIISYRERV